MKTALSRRTALVGSRAIAAAIVAALAFGSQAEEIVPIEELSNHTHFHGIAVNPTNPDEFFLATHHGFFRVGLDGMARLASERVDDFMGFTPHPTDPTVLYASGHPAGGGNLGVLMSTDGGRTWTQIAPGVGGPVDFHQMDVSPADPQIMYGAYHGIQVSRDGGKTWSIAGPQPEGLIDLAASPAEKDRLYAATETSLLVSGDAGQSWQPLLQQGPVSMVQAAPDGTLYAFVVGKGLMRAEEPPVAWTTVSDDFGNGYLLHLAASPTDPSRLFAVTGEAEVLSSTDGGETWTALAADQVAQ